MKLYEINQEIEKAFEECIDLETGEIKDFSKLEELTLAKNDKVREIALFIINLEGEERLIDEQIKKFLARRKTIKNKISGLRAYLQYHTQGESYTFTEVKVFYKTSEETVITDEEAFEKYCKRHKELCTCEVKPNKIAIKEAIRGGLKVKGAEVVIKNNLQVK